MKRRRVAFDYRLSDTLALVQRPGLLLASTKRSGESNVMTIGWGSVGIIWGKPIFITLVRPSRYTYEFIEDSHEFTVNVPTEEMRRWVGICGKVSGRDVDKFQDHDVAVSAGQDCSAVTIDACPMVYECRAVHFSDLVPAYLSPEIDARSYPGGDYHRVYFGEILGAYASEGY